MATRYTFAQLQQLWTQAGGSSTAAPMAAAVALAESGGNPNSINTANSNGTVDRGLWQINSVHGSQSTFDPLANARAAVGISKGGTDWRPWCVAWSNGRCGGTFLGAGAPVLKFLPQGATNTGVVPTGGTGNPTVQNAGIGIPNPFDPTGFITQLFGLPTAGLIGQLILRWITYVSMVIMGVLMIIVGLVFLGLSTRTAQSLARNKLGLGPQPQVVILPGTPGEPGPPGTPGEPGPPGEPAPETPPKPKRSTYAAKHEAKVTKVTEREVLDVSKGSRPGRRKKPEPLDPFA